MKNLLLLVTILLFSYCIHADCPNPCTSDNPCILSQCIGDECVESVRDPLPPNCCNTIDDCRAGECFFAEVCDQRDHICQYSFVCESSAHRPCTADSDCIDDPCRTTKCIDNVCQFSGNIERNNPICCVQNSDCRDVPCTEAICNNSLGLCIYKQIADCIVPSYVATLPTIFEEEESPSPSPSDGSVASQEDPGLGDIIGAIIGFIILGLLVFAFIVVVILMILQKCVKKCGGE